MLRPESDTTFHPSAVASIQQLRARFPDNPFLTLGQTVFWDEPVKAAFCRILEDVAPEATIVAAVHDTDYFAKLPRFENRAEKFVMLSHNDGDTRGLWSAAGELSCLFGSETVPSRQVLTEHGVAFDLVARDYPGGVEALLNQETAAWGWRALVHTEPHPLITADVKLSDIAPALREQLEWGFTTSLEMLQDTSGEAVASQITIWIDEYLESDQEATLSDLYRWLTPRLWALVRGAGSCNLQTSASLRIFRFNQSTALLPRFRFVDLILQPATRDLARWCYDDAVRGSGIYTLDQFGPGALPFDVVIPGHGRGTLRLHDGSLYIETEEPITLCTGCDCGSIQELAEVLEAKFGDGVALVGKAVALISMLAHEFIFVFHEKASSYTSLTQKMNESLRAGGVALQLCPLLRIKYHTWNSLEATPAIFHLPPHLSSAFGQGDIAVPDLAARWESVCAQQDELCADLKSCRSPRELMGFLAKSEGGKWQESLTEYAHAREVIKALRDRTQILENEATALRAEAHRATEQAGAIERAKGEDFRNTVQPLRERLFDIKEAAAARLNPVGESGQPRRLSREEKVAEAQRTEIEAKEIEDLRTRIAAREPERAHFDAEINALRRHARQLQTTAKTKITERINLEKSEVSLIARDTIKRLEYEAELARLYRVRAAITVSRSLRYTNYRPTSWWFPLVSPDGHWFDQLVSTAEARIEEI